jgi:hypothetical protein
MKVGDLVQKMNPWKVYNDWMDFPNDDEPILVLRVADCKMTALFRHLWTGIERWGACEDYEVISESR